MTQNVEWFCHLTFSSYLDSEIRQNKSLDNVSLQEEYHTRTMILLDDDEEDQFSFDDYLLASRYLLVNVLVDSLYICIGYWKHLRGNHHKMGPMVQFYNS
jgi:hypothetical protein